MDGISRENFQRLYPKLAKQLRKGGALTEDEINLYRLTKTELVVERKAKVDVLETKRPFGAEKYEKFDHKTAKINPHDYYKAWDKWSFNQKTREILG